MKESPSVLIWNAHWETLGGGEKYALELGTALKLNGYSVFYVGICAFPGQKFVETFNLDISRFEYLQVGSEGEVSLLATSVDLFVNASYGSRLLAPHSNSIYICHFPFIGRLPRIVERLFRIDRVLQNNERKTYADPSGSLVIESDSTFKVNNICRFKILHQQGSWRLMRESANGERISTDFKNDLPEGFYFLENVSSDRTTLCLNGLSKPSFLKLLIDHLTRSIFFKDTYKQVWVHSIFVSKWTKALWKRDPFVIYPPVTQVQLPITNRDPYQIISVGRFMSRRSGHSKNQLELIKAFAKLTKRSDLPWSLHLVGGVSKDQQKYFERVEAFSRGLPVTLHPNASHEELISLYSSSSIYWHASGYKQPKSHPERFEHFGITVVEAMSSGLIPFVFSVGGPAEILSDYPALTYSSMSELLDKTVAIGTGQMDGLRAEMKFVAEKFSVKHFYENAIRKIDTFGIRDTRQNDR